MQRGDPQSGGEALDRGDGRRGLVGEEGLVAALGMAGGLRPLGAELRERGGVVDLQQRVENIGLGDVSAGGVGLCHGLKPSWQSRIYLAASIRDLRTSDGQC